MARLKGLVRSHRFLGEMERANREGSRESSEDPLDAPLRRAESRPLAKVGNPNFESNPDIIAATLFLPTGDFSCACGVEVGEIAESRSGLLSDTEVSR